ncbi:MAG: hypothetical protein Q7S22_02655 [Candidatus Micrarchaeota archaeon]|nr:hypothetical protein [Candidatus Micrarchaeota archaeon]
MPIRPPQPKGSGFKADANVANATLRPLSDKLVALSNKMPIVVMQQLGGQLGGQSCVNSALPPKVETIDTTYRVNI